MDPIEIFPAEIVENIFHHLQWNEVIESTLVSSSWNDFVGGSLRCMDKFGLRLDNRKSSDISSEIGFLIGKRKYRNARIDYGWFKDSEDKIYDLMKSNRFWRSVNMFRLTFSSASSFNNFIETLEDSVEEIGLQFVEICHHDEPVKTFSFKKLKALSLSNCDENICEKLFTNCSSLHKLLLYANDDSVTKVDLNLNISKHYFDILKRQKNIKILKFCINKVRDEDTPENLAFPFELEDLNITFPTHSSRQRAFATGFLRQQTKMTQLHLSNYYFDLSLLPAAIEIKSLKSLKVTDFSRNITNFSSLPSNNSIEILIIPCIEFNVERFIKIAPKVKKIFLYKCGKRLAEFIAENLKFLEELGAVRFYDEVQDILPRVKLSKIDLWYPYEIVEERFRLVQERKCW